MEQPSLELQTFYDYSLAVSRDTLEQRLQRLLGSPEKLAEHTLLYVDLDGNAEVDPGAEANVEKAFLAMLMKDVVWASSIEDCVARIRHSEFVMLMAFCSLSRALQTARLLRLWFRARIESTHQSGMTPDLHIGIVPAVVGCDPRQVLAHARNACESAKRRGRESICVHWVNDTSGTDERIRESRLSVSQYQQ